MDHADHRPQWALIALNLLLAYVFCQIHLAKSYHIFKWEEFIAFKGLQPFQLRLLPFLLARGLDMLHPLGEAGIRQFFQLTDFLSVFSAAMILQRSARFIAGTLAAVVLCLALFWWQTFALFVISDVHNYYYPYDALSLVIMALACHLIITRAALSKLCAVVVIGMLNRETAVIIPLLYLAYRHAEWRSLYKGFAGMLALCVLIKMAITLHFGAANNSFSLWVEPGKLRMVYNFSFLTLKASQLHTFNVFFIFGGAWLLLFLKTRLESPYKAWVLCFAPYFLGMMFVGNLSEIRIFGEFIPVLCLVLVHKFSAGLVPKPE